jgi:hypothetical protein
VLIYHHGCPTCREAITQFRGLGLNAADDTRRPRVALVETPPFHPSNGAYRAEGTETWLHGKLSDAREWFVEAPALVLLEHGTVVFAETGERVLHGGLVRLKEELSDQ